MMNRMSSTGRAAFLSSAALIAIGIGAPAAAQTAKPQGQT